MNFIPLLSFINHRLKAMHKPWPTILNLEKSADEKHIRFLLRRNDTLIEAAKNFIIRKAILKLIT